VDELGEEENPKDPAGNKTASEDIITQQIQERGGSDPETLQTPQTIQLAAAETGPASQAFKPNTQDSGPILLIPSVRHMLKDLNIQVDEVQGTGRHGRISKEDVQRYYSAKESRSSSSHRNIQSSFELTPAPATSTVVAAEDRLIPLSPTARTMFKTMTHSLKIPQFLYTHTVDLTSTNILRRNFNASLIKSFDARLTILPFIIKAISYAFIQQPQLNAHLDTDTDPEKPQLLLRGQHNFGIAIDTPQGLVVPVIENVQAHSISSLAAEISRLSALAREAKLGVNDFKDATFTVSNIGSIGGATMNPIIVSPQVGIVGIGRIEAVPRFQKDEKTGEEVLVRREEVVLSWSADHRVLDGATVARCAEAVSEFLRDWTSLLVIMK
jgi:2-oxoisovalerate dehydrogenase E2 component (dihydrolipoyl transacylase)